MLGNGFYIALAVFFMSVHVDAYHVSAENQLKKKLLEAYDTSTNPTIYGKLMHVGAIISVKSIAELDEMMEKLSTNLELQIGWKDEYLTWNKTTAVGIDRLKFNKQDVWVPEFYVVNKHTHISYGIEETRYLPVRVISSGKCLFTQNIIAETQCDLDFSRFPFDNHTCEIELEVNKWNLVISIALDESVLKFYKPYGSWDVIGKPYFNGNVTPLIIQIMLARRPTFILINLILPMTLLALLSPLVFLLPNKSGERVGFSITVLLAISVFMTILSDHVPPKSQPFPLVLTMLFISYSLMIVVVMVVFINARVYNLPDHVGIPRPLYWLTRFTRRICCCFRRRPTAVKAVDTENEREMNVAVYDVESPSRKEVPVKNVTWKDISWTIDMICMTLLWTLQLVSIVFFLINAKVKK